MIACTLFIKPLYSLKSFTPSQLLRANSQPWTLHVLMPLLAKPSMLEIIEDHDESLFKRMRDPSLCLHHLLPLVPPNTLGRLRSRGHPYTLPQINFKQHKLSFPIRCLFNNQDGSHYNIIPDDEKQNNVSACCITNSLDLVENSEYTDVDSPYYLTIIG